MHIPQSFRDAIDATFYDKTITKYTSQDTVDGEGWARKSGTTVVSGTFMGNVHFDHFQKIQETYGIRDDIDMLVSTAEVVEQNSIVGYGGKQYYVFEVIPTDSHYLLVTREWSSKSSTSISS